MGKISKTEVELIGAGAIGIGLYLLWRRGWSLSSEVVDNLGAAIGKPIGAGGNVVDATSEEARWEIPYRKHPKDTKEFYGTKGPVWIHLPGFTDAKLLFNPPAGTIMVNMAKYNLPFGQQAGSGKLYPVGYAIRKGGDKQSFLRGDPRALYCLDALMRVSGLTTVDIASMHRPNDKHDFGHKSGCAIDLTDEYQFVKLLDAAIKVRMPVVVIQRQPQGPWRIYKYARWDGQNAPCVPKFMFTTSSPHRNHHHMILPRPNAVAVYFNKPKSDGVKPYTGSNPDHLGIPGVED